MKLSLRSAWPAAALLLAAFPAFPQTPENEDPPELTFRADVNLVRMLVTVKDSSGAPIGNLTRDEIQISDNGEERPIAIFEKSINLPMSVALLVDASLSTMIELEFEKAAAERFFAHLLGEGSHPRDRVAVFKFSDYIDLLSHFTSNQKQLSKALGQIKAESGTSLYDAVLLASETLERREGRRVIVIITDGGDTTSRIRFAEALEAAHDVDAVIYGILVTPIKSDAGRNTGGENALKALCSNTGGLTFINVDAQSIDPAFDEILQSLRTQYLLGYYPPEHTSTRERFRRVQVAVDRPGATVLSRTGYFVPEQRATPPPVSKGRPSIEPSPRRWKEAAKPEPPP